MKSVIDEVKNQNRRRKGKGSGSCTGDGSQVNGSPGGARKVKLPLPEGTHLITIPVVEMENLAGGDGDSALYQRVTKKSKKEWVFNPRNKSAVCILHEYLQHSMRKPPKYVYGEVDSSSTPYSCSILISGISYGNGIGSSKKLAKNDAAKKTLEILIPELKHKLRFYGDSEEQKKSVDDALTVSE
jgi:hypothetical protein